MGKGRPRATSTPRPVVPAVPQPKVIAVTCPSVVARPPTGVTLAFLTCISLLVLVWSGTAVDAHSLIETRIFKHRPWGDFAPNVAARNTILEAFACGCFFTFGVEILLSPTSYVVLAALLITDWLLK